MPRSHTPDTPATARPIYSTASASSYYGDTRTPRASDYSQHVFHDRQLGPALNDLEAMWGTQPNISRPPRPELYGKPDEVRVAMDERGEVIVYDAGVPLRLLSAQAPVFRPSSALSTRSSTSTTSSSTFARSLSTVNSSDTSATSVSSARPSFPGTKFVASMTRSPAPPLRTLPVFPHVDPGEQAYRAYRERLRREPDVTTPIKCILETGVGSYDLTQHIAILASRLSADALCGPKEFKAHLRTEALRMFHSYWHENGPWRSETPVPAQYLVSRGINVASFMGSLFRYELISVADVHACLDVLLSAGPGFLTLQAAHAAVVHCGERICAEGPGLDLAHLRLRLCGRTADGRYVWGPHDESRILLQDLLDNLNRWSTSHELAQIHTKAAAHSTPSATARSRRELPVPASQTRLHGYFP
ncbi:hypothetical protein B0H17DRAFT_1225237 [Mycena rosella]|uniref:Uncharacterized protein n=1 Tax=Mycena rosella TaxID=1033263 RepID=A0AAD7D8T6_MYCRO|nr:hypothetical protein B0H17DRAFT_1225237 [Mycena rosella]